MTRYIRLRVWGLGIKACSRTRSGRWCFYLHPHWLLAGIVPTDDEWDALGFQKP